MSGLREDKKNKIRKTILSVSKEAFLEKGYENTSTKEIAKRANIGVGTVFNYFPTKADILIEIISGNIEIYDKDKKIQILKSDAAEDVIHRFIRRLLKSALAFPRNIIKEFSVASLSLLKNKTQLMHKVIDMDLNITVKLNDLIIDLQNKGLIESSKDSRGLAKALFSSFFFDTMLYIFDDRISKEMMHSNIKSSIIFLLS